MGTLRFGIATDDETQRLSLTAQLELLGERVERAADVDYLFFLGGAAPDPDLAAQLLLPEPAFAPPVATTAQPSDIKGMACAARFPQPLRLPELQGLLALLYRRQREEIADAAEGIAGVVGASAPIQVLRQRVAQVATTDSTVLLTGPSGTGKSFLAETVHRHSARASGPFIPINCGAIPAELVESELFGHEKGAFTGAIERKIGRFERAAGGTLFLDEVGELPGPMQVKLLRALQERSFERVGGMETLSADVRVIAATNADLPALIAERRFREDLFYRLNVFPIALPALKDRLEDLPELVASLQQQLTEQTGGCVRLTDDALERLRGYHWPGNLRELRNLLERLHIEFGPAMLAAEDLPDRLLSNQPRQPNTPAVNPDAVVRSDSRLPLNGIDLKGYLAGLEQQLIEQALRDCDSVVARAADRLQIRRTTLVEKMRKYGIDRVTS